MKFLLLALIVTGLCAVSINAEIVGENGLFPEPIDWVSETNGNLGATRRDIHIDQVQPNWAHLGYVTTSADQSHSIITITGCGFSRESYAVCVFDLTFTSISSRILDDNTIICELPFLEISQFETLPYYSRLDIFWGNHISANFEQLTGLHNSNTPVTTSPVINNQQYVQNAWSYVDQFRWGPQLDCSPLSPKRGPTSGASVQISGEGFLDSNLPSTLQVYFDDQPATSVQVVSDNLIRATAPSVDDLGIDALVSLVWSGSFADHFESQQTEIYLWSSDLFHYGPKFGRVDGLPTVSPSCSYVNDTRTLTIHGEGFADPLFSASPVSPSGTPGRSTILLELVIEGSTSPVVTWDDQRFNNPDSVSNGPLSLQVVASVNGGGDQITFTAPNWFLGTDLSDGTDVSNNWANLLGKKVLINVFWRQTLRFRNEPPHGDNDFAQWINGQSGLFYFLGPRFDELDHQSWHFGGGDIVCITGDCFDEYALQRSLLTQDFQIFHTSIAGGREIWDSTLGYTSTDTQICATTAIEPTAICDTNPNPNRFDLDVWYEWNDSDLGITIPPQTAPFDTGYTIGPELVPADISRPVVNPGTITLFGTNLLWDTVDPFDTVTAVATGTFYAVGQDFDVIDLNNDQLTIDIPQNAFGYSMTVRVDWDSPISSNICDQFGVLDVYWGPKCTFNDVYQHGKLVGGDTVTITGENFNGYQPRAFLCDKETPSASPLPSKIQNGINVPECIPIDPDVPDFYEATADLTVSNTAITFQTQGTDFDFDQRNAYRGARNWGQRFDIVVYFNTQADDFIEDAPAFDPRFKVNFTNCADAYDGDNTDPFCYSSAMLYCGLFRYGPVFDDLTPCQGPSGPADTFVTPITISGSNFVDAWAVDARPSQGTSVTRANNPHLVLFGSLFQQPIISDASITSSAMNTQTVANPFSYGGLPATRYGEFAPVNGFPLSWEGETDVNAHSVGIFFDTCNTTLLPDVIIHWGPAFPACPITWDVNGVNVTVGGGCDIYGLPADGIPLSYDDLLSNVPVADVIGFTGPRSSASNHLLNGAVLDAYIRVSTNAISNFCRQGDCNSGDQYDWSRFLGQCVIDGVVVDALIDKTSGFENTHNPSILCKIPNRPFGTQANVCLRFPDRTSADDTLFHFGEDTDNYYYGERIAVNDFANYYEICVEDQHLFYTPYIWIDEDQNAPASGLSRATLAAVPARIPLDIFCIGCYLYDLQSVIPLDFDGSLPRFFVGGFEAEPIAPFAVDTEIRTYTVNLPIFSAEFNTNVPVSIGFLQQYSNCEEDPTTNISGTAFFKVWAPHTFHWGPTCSGSANFLMYGTTDGQPTGSPLATAPVSLVYTLGSGSTVDCYSSEYEYQNSLVADTTNCDTDPDFNQNCLVPQPSNNFKLIGTPYTANGTGSTRCLFRHAEINLLSGTTVIHQNVEEEDDLVQIDFDGDIFQLVSPLRNNSNLDIDCVTYGIQVVFPDALVSTVAQRTLTCSGSGITYGPTVDAFSELLYVIDGVDTYYGWPNDGTRGDSLSPGADAFVTVTAGAVVDPFFSINTYELGLSFGGSPATVRSTPAPTLTIAEFNVRPGAWQTTQTFQAYYTRSSGGNKCLSANKAFHYGPDLRFSNMDSALCTTTRCPFNDANTVTITGRGFDCCGYQLNSNTFDHACHFGPTSGAAYWSNDDTWEPASATTATKIVCNTPDNFESEFASKRLMNFGVFFGAVENFPTSNLSTALPSFCDNVITIASTSVSACSLTGFAAVGPNNHFDNNALESPLNRMGPICYGPKILAWPEHETRLSGFAIRDSATDADVADFVSLPYSYKASGSGVCPTGGAGSWDFIYPTFDSEELTELYPDELGSGDPANFTVIEPFATCTYAGDEGGEDVYAAEAPYGWGSGFTTSGALFCPTRILKKQCSDAPDTVTVKFLNVTDFVNGAFNEYTPSSFIRSAGPSGSAGNWFAETPNSPLSGTVTYGPKLDSSVSGLGNFDSQTDDDGVTTYFLPSVSFNVDMLDRNNIVPADSVATLTVTGQYFDDWLATSVTVSGNYANDKVSLVGNQRYTCLFGSIDLAADPKLSLIHTPFVAFPWDLPLLSAAKSVASPFDFNFLCDIPQNSFNAWGYVYVLVDPHIDGFTQALSPYDLFDLSLQDYRIGTNAFWHWTPYVDTAAKDWTAPDSVEPITFYGGGFEFYQTLSCSFGDVPSTSIILNDRTVICVTPPYLAPQIIDVSFTFGIFSHTGYTASSSRGVSVILGSFPASQCVDSYDCQNSTNTAVYTGFTVTGVTDFCPRTGPTQGNTLITLTTVGLEHYSDVECVFHFSSGETIAPVTLVNVSGTSGLVTTCRSPPSSDDVAHVLITIRGHYTPAWSASVPNQYYSTELGSFWFDYDLPHFLTVTPSFVEYGSAVTVTISGQVFNGGANPVDESDVTNWNYYCVWQVPLTQDLLTLPIDGQLPTFPAGERLTSYAVPTNTTVDTECAFLATSFTCETPDFEQFGNYHFGFYFSGELITETVIFAVIPLNATLTDISPSSHNVSALYDISYPLKVDVYSDSYEVTLTGTGLNGGRTTSDAHQGCYLVRFLTPVDEQFLVAADLISDNTITTIAPFFSAFDLLENYFESIPNANLPARCQNKPTATKTVTKCMYFYCSHSWNAQKAICNPPFPVEVTLTNDCGYTWSNPQELTYYLPFPSASSAMHLSLGLLVALLVAYLF